MENNLNDFIKQLKVLYIEDEEPARKMFNKYLNKKFDTSVECKNGLDGFIEFEKAYYENVPFDLVISDINMPKMDGIEFLEKIRELGSDVPFIFTTARSESEQMIKAINLHVNSYLLKPLDFELIDSNIQNICKDIYFRRRFEAQRKETDAILSLLNKEAIVSKTDYDGIITYVNDAFLEVSGFTKEEVIGKNHNIVRHPDNPKSLFKEMWDTIKSGKTWEGRIKNQNKQKETYFINTKIIPLYDDAGKSINEFISIRFQVTDEENQRRKQNKRFLEQLSLFKKEISSLKKEKEQLINQFASYDDNTQLIKERNAALEKKIKTLLQQISAYEQNNLEMSKVDLMMKKDKSKQFQQVAFELQKNKTQVKNLSKELEYIKKIVLDKDKTIESLEKKKEDYEKRIKEQLDLIDNLQKENKVLRGEEVEGK